MEKQVLRRTQKNPQATQSAEYEGPQGTGKAIQATIANKDLQHRPGWRQMGRGNPGTRSGTQGGPLQNNPNFWGGGNSEYSRHHTQNQGIQFENQTPCHLEKQQFEAKA